MSKYRILLLLACLLVAFSSYCTEFSNPVQDAYGESPSTTQPTTSTRVDQQKNSNGSGDSSINWTIVWTAIGALATVIIAIFTAWVWKETKRSRLNQEPQHEHLIFIHTKSGVAHKVTLIMKITKNTIVYINYICLIWWQCMVVAVAAENGNDTSFLLKLSLEELLQVKITTIATGKQQLAIFAPANTTTISSEDMELMAALDVDEVLEGVPGLHVARNSMSFYSPIYALGGIASTIYNPEALILLNGIPINTLYTGARILGGYGGGIPTTAIERIEVIRGPGSALYGADALSGVINIITKTTTNENEGTTTGIRFGSFQRRDGWMLHRGKYQDWNIGLSVNFSDTQGQHQTVEEDTQTQYDRIFNTHVSLAPSGVTLTHRNWDIDFNADKGQWKIHTLYQKRNNIGNGVGIAQAIDPNGRNLSNRIYTDISYNNPDISKNWELTAKVGYSNTDYFSERVLILYPPGAFGGAYPNGMRASAGVWERDAYSEVIGNYKGFKNHQLRLGTSYRFGEVYKVSYNANYGINPHTNQPIPPTEELTDLSGTSATFLPTLNRHSWSLFIQDIWTWNERWEATYGGRYDNYSDFGSTFNPRFALVWKTTPEFTTKFLYGSSLFPGIASSQ